MEACKTAEEGYAVACTVTSDITLEEFQEVMQTLYKKVKEDGELTEEDLETVTGGLDTEVIVGLSVAGGAVAASTAAVVSALAGGV